MYGWVHLRKKLELSVEQKVEALALLKEQPLAGQPTTPRVFQERKRAASEGRLGRSLRLGQSCGRCLHRPAEVKMPLRTGQDTAWDLCSTTKSINRHQSRLLSLW